MTRVEEDEAPHKAEISFVIFYLQYHVKGIVTVRYKPASLHYSSLYIPGDMCAKSLQSRDFLHCQHTFILILAIFMTA